MKKTPVLLTVTFASITPSLATETAMKAVETYTTQLEKAIVTNDKPNAQLYAQALATLIMTGEVKEPSQQPAYQGNPLTPIQARTYKMRTTPANPAEKAALHKALDVLAYVNTRSDLAIALNGIIKLPADKSSSLLAKHQTAAYTYYTKGHLQNKFSPRVTLAFLDGLATLNKLYNQSPYRTGAIEANIKDSKPLENSPAGIIKTNHPWITEFKSNPLSNQQRNNLQHLLGSIPLTENPAKVAPPPPVNKAENAPPPPPPAPKTPIDPATAERAEVQRLAELERTTKGTAATEQAVVDKLRAEKAAAERLVAEKATAERQAAAEKKAAQDQFTQATAAVKAAADQVNQDQAAEYSVASVRNILQSVLDAGRLDAIFVSNGIDFNKLLAWISEPSDGKKLLASKRVFDLLNKSAESKAEITKILQGPELKDWQRQREAEADKASFAKAKATALQSLKGAKFTEAETKTAVEEEDERALVKALTILKTNSRGPKLTAANGALATFSESRRQFKELMEAVPPKARPAAKKKAINELLAGGAFASEIPPKAFPILGIRGTRSIARSQI